MTNDLQIWQLILEASWLVKGVMAILLAASVASWMIIFNKRQIIGKAEKAADVFEERFWSGIDLNNLHENISSAHRLTSGMERIFDAGFAEFSRMRQQSRMAPTEMVEGAQRAMRIALTRETEELEHHLNFLATVGSTSPYVGLFGTVWGIMTSFHQLANVNQATIAMVAPGISEALVATAMGLFAAIPAVIGYNRFSNKVERLEVRYDNFKEEFSSILQRQAHALSRE
ncbi:MAG TPA: protein TolQ [Xanthomonadales bacterium]|nr:protein TolQ [Xanthomonadales bacterium]